MNRLVTPCCEAEFKPFYRYEGRGFLADKIVDGYMCLGDDCMNEWDDQGFRIRDEEGR